MVNYKTKTCLICGKEYTPNSSRQKYCSDCRVIAEKEQHKQWLKNNPEYNKQYEKNRSGQRVEYSKQWRQAHKEEIKKQSKQYYKDNAEQEKKYSRQYRKTLTGKESKKRNEAKRRQLGFILLNDFFEGSVAHHRSKDLVEYILEWLHKSISHNVWTGQGMAEINTLAMEYLKEVE